MKKNNKKFSFKLEKQRDKTKLLVVGAGEAGRLIASEIKKHPGLNYDLIGFIDDNSLKKGKKILNYPILGTSNIIPRVVKEKEIEQIIIAIPSAQGEDIRRIVSYCERSGVNFKILPGVFEILDSLKSGKAYFKNIREVRMEDLLRRKAIVNFQGLKSFLEKKKILITGAAGSIGSELTRQISEFGFGKLILLDNNESRLYELEKDLERKNNISDFKIIICDIKDRKKISFLIKRYKPDIIFHAAAFKHVPLLELNPDEAVNNNVFGTKNVAEAADKNNVEKFILISTDKAVNPKSIMGASKRIAELIINQIQRESKTKFISVRFGNVLGSSGSVVPLFEKQIKSGGPITVTSPKATRFFMTIPEAVQLIIQASAMSKEGGKIYILDMGKQYKIIDLAKDLIKLMGLKPHKDIPIVFIGMRPGEKMHEELLTKEEKKMMLKTKNKKIFIVKQNNKFNFGEFNKKLEELNTLLLNRKKNEKIIKKIKEIVNIK